MIGALSIMYLFQATFIYEEHSEYFALKHSLINSSEILIQSHAKKTQSILFLCYQFVTKPKKNTQLNIKYEPVVPRL